jgi:hypothetical protein
LGGKEVVMDSTLFAALIAGSSAVLGSLVTGLFLYFAATRQREAERLKRKLIQAYMDVASFHRLEERYIKALETKEKTANAYKLGVRKKMRAEGLASPSKNATALNCEREIRKLLGYLPNQSSVSLSDEQLGRSRPEKGRSVDGPAPTRPSKKQLQKGAAARDTEARA